jgi:hypothetical protein
MNAPSKTDPTGFSILLLDPHPDLMTNAITRAGSSLFILYERQKLTQENVTAMYNVVIAALETLAKISHIAAEAIPLLQKKYAAFIDRAMTTSEVTPQLNAFSVAVFDSDGADFDGFQSFEKQSSSLSFVDFTVEQFENGQDSSSFPDKLAPIELESLAADLDLSRMGGDYSL